MNHRFGTGVRRPISALPCPCCGGRMLFKRTTPAPSDAITHGCGYCGAEITRTTAVAVEEEFERTERLR
jgi:hypothetical protein